MFALRNQTHTARLRTKVDMNRCGKCGPVIGRILVAAWIAYVDKTSEARVCCTRMPFNPATITITMWRCLHVSNPTKKASTCKRDHDADYERNKRSRAYRQQWEKEFSWLTYDGKLMFCDVCRSVQMAGSGAGPGRKQNLFFHGTDNFRLDSIKSLN